MAFAQVHSVCNGNWTTPLLSRWSVYLKNFSWQKWLQQPPGSSGDPSRAGRKPSHSLSELNRWQHELLNRCITGFASQREELQT